MTRGESRTPLIVVGSRGMLWEALGRVAVRLLTLLCGVEMGLRGAWGSLTDERGSQRVMALPLRPRSMPLPAPGGSWAATWTSWAETSCCHSNPWPMDERRKFSALNCLGFVPGKSQPAVGVGTWCPWGICPTLFVIRRRQRRWCRHHSPAAGTGRLSSTPLAAGCSATAGP